MRRLDRTVLVAAFERPGARSAGRGGALLEQVMRAAAARRRLRARLVPGYLPSTVGLLRRALPRVLACEPDAVILLAEAGAGDDIVLERFARNRAPPGRGGRGAPRLVSTGPAAYLGGPVTEPALRMLARAGIPCRPGADARPSAANAGFYLALHRLRATEPEPAPVVLLRIPERSPGLPLRRSARAVLLLVEHLASRTAALPSPLRRPQSRTPRAAPTDGT